MFSTHRCRWSKMNRLVHYFLVVTRVQMTNHRIGMPDSFLLQAHNNVVRPSPECSCLWIARRLTMHDHTVSLALKRVHGLTSKTRMYVLTTPYFLDSFVFDVSLSSASLLFPLFAYPRPLVFPPSAFRSFPSMDYLRSLTLFPFPPRTVSLAVCTVSNKSHQCQ